MTGAHRLLLIDDDEDTLIIASAALERSGGWAVSTAASGAAGIEMAQARIPDVVVIDVMMPELDGPATMEALRSHPPTAAVPVILLAPRPDPAEVVRLTGLGARGVVAKPFDPLALSDQLLAVLGWDRASG